MDNVVIVRFPDKDGYVLEQARVEMFNIGHEVLISGPDGQERSYVVKNIIHRITKLAFDQSKTGNLYHSAAVVVLAVHKG